MAITTTADIGSSLCWLRSSMYLGYSSHLHTTEWDWIAPAEPESAHGIHWPQGGLSVTLDPILFPTITRIFQDNLHKLTVCT